MKFQSVVFSEAFQLTENTFQAYKETFSIRLTDGRTPFENSSLIRDTWYCSDRFFRYEPRFRRLCRRVQTKEQAIETKMEYARKHGNQEQLRGLEEALSQVRQWCSDGTLRSKAELNILEKQDKVKERQADLDKAVTEGKGEKKIAKLQRKLGEAKEDLAQAVAKRDALAQ